MIPEERYMLEKSLRFMREQSERRTLLSSLLNLPFYLVSICHGLDPSSKSDSLQSSLSWSFSVRIRCFHEVSFARMPLSISKRSYMPCWLDCEMDPLIFRFARKFHPKLHQPKIIQVESTKTSTKTLEI